MYARTLNAIYGKLVSNGILTFHHQNTMVGTRQNETNNS
jgi:hypothetical protein